MEKNSYIFNFKRWPKGLLLALFFIFLFELLNVVYDDRTYPKPYDGLRLKIKNRISQQKNNVYDVLVFGDCYNLTGIDAQAIERSTSFKVYNFSTHAAQTIFSNYLMLKNYLENSQKKPKYLIMNFLPESVVFTREQLLSGDASLYGFLDGNNKEFLDEFGPLLMIKWLIPSLKHQEFLKKRFWKFQLPKQAEIDRFIESVYRDRGYYSLYGDKIYKGSLYYNFNKYKKPVSSFFDKYFRKMMDLAKENEIQVIYTMYTAPPDWYWIYTKSGMRATYFDYFKNVGSDYANFLYYMPQSILNEMGYYRDTTHLNWIGAKVLSKFLSDVILLE